MTLWMCVTADEYELPLGVYMSIREMSEKLQIPYKTIENSMSRSRRTGSYTPYVKIKVENEENIK